MPAAISAHVPRPRRHRRPGASARPFLCACPAPAAHRGRRAGTCRPVRPPGTRRSPHRRDPPRAPSPTSGHPRGRDPLGRVRARSAEGRRWVEGRAGFGWACPTGPSGGGRSPPGRAAVCP